MAIGGFLSRPARRQVITVGRQAMASGILPGHVSAEYVAHDGASELGRDRYNEKERGDGRGRYSIIAADCVKHPPRVARGREPRARVRLSR